MIININNKNSNNDIKKRCIVQGKAGSWKSSVIHEIVKRIINNFGNSVKIAAFNDAVALNVDGNTLHTLLRIPVNSKAFESLEGQAAQNFQIEHKNLKFIIIGEMSLVGTRLLNHVEKRCSKMFPNIDDHFGSIHIYLFGDYRQLPSVLD